MHASSKVANISCRTETTTVCNYHWGTPAHASKSHHRVSIDGMRYEMAYARSEGHIGGWSANTIFRVFCDRKPVMRFLSWTWHRLNISITYRIGTGIAQQWHLAFLVGGLDGVKDIMAS